MDSGDTELVVEAGVGYCHNVCRIARKEVGRWVGGVFVGGGSEGVEELASSGPAGDVVHEVCRRGRR